MVNIGVAELVIIMAVLAVGAVVIGAAVMLIARGGQRKG